MFASVIIPPTTREDEPHQRLTVPTQLSAQEKVFAKICPEDLASFQAAYELADEVHKLQFRKSGERYIVHPLAVAEILLDCGYGTFHAGTGVLHDVPEDCPDGIERIRTSIAILPVFGEKIVAACIQLNKHLTKLKDIVDVPLRVKIADRINNIETFEYCLGSNNQITTAKRKISEAFNILIPKLTEDPLFNDNDRLLLNRFIQSIEFLIRAEHANVFTLPFIQYMRREVGKLELAHNSLVLT
jgi:hypothetical protein